MVRTCKEGHNIPEGKEICRDGHPLIQEPSTGATAAVPISLTQQQLQEIVQGAIAGALAAHDTAHTRDNTPHVKKPERPTIGQQ